MTSSDAGPPPLELSRLNEIAVGDTEILHKLLRLFLTDVQEFAPKLKQALEGNDSAAFASVAHRIKGGAGQVGAHALQTLSDRLETMGRDNNLSNAQETLDAFNQEYDCVIHFLEQTLHS